MMSCHSDSEEDQFFETPNEIASGFDLESDCFDDCSTSTRVSDNVSNDYSYEFWTRTPESVRDRRNRFFEHMGFGLNHKQIEKKEENEISCEEIKIDMDRINVNSGAVLMDSNSEASFISRESSTSVSCSSTEELLEECDSEDNIVGNVADLAIAEELVMNGVGKNGTVGRLCKLRSNKLGKNSVNSWIRTLRSKVHTKSAKGELNSKLVGLDVKEGPRLRRIRVRSYNKRSKELSSLYEEQDFRAHKGSILVMKFSPDGRFLASAGEDGIVRVWKVIEDESKKDIDVRDIDPSCLYFLVNDGQKLVPLDFGKDKNLKMRRLGKSTKPGGCVIFPPKVFRLLEEPMHEFHGHSGEVLALSWSSNERLLSSSVDKTVRLWHVGLGDCIQVFRHNNYVTCVEFNPVDDNYFISGSIDGKIRIWEVGGCRVVDWIDIRDIVTAVCYAPSGERGIVGSMNGSCRFYDIIDNQLQLDTQIFLAGRKKLPCKRITGFQFSPSDPNKVLVTSADSQVRVLCGADVIFKLKGPRLSGCQVTASFTRDGTRIVSGNEDSSVHVWDHASHSMSPPKAKNICARESFVSRNSSIAIPWSGMRTKSTSLPNPPLGNDILGSILQNAPGSCGSLDAVPSSLPDCFSLNRLRGPATWPEEKLLDPNLLPSIGMSELKVLKSSCSNVCSSCMWGLVIVTAGRDGRIRTYHNYGLPIHL